VIQAGGARRLLRSEPDRARDSILSVEQTGRGALADLRRLLGMLRKDDDPRALTPQPGLDQLTALLAQVREEGMECELSTAGEQIDLTPGIDLVGYRVIETALQLLVRHRSRLATVTVRYENEWLELEISGTKSIPDLEHELNGIGERLALYDGSLLSLPPRDGGFRVQARLPLGGAVAA
jgi:signal transduction histidine kinase